MTKLFNTAVYPRRKHFAVKRTKNSRPWNNEGNSVENIMTRKIIENKKSNRITTGKHLYVDVFTVILGRS